MNRINEGKQCPYCGEDSKLTPSQEIYFGKDYGPMWACIPCNAWVGCHKGTERALGRLANSELRKAKMSAHAIFDPLWVAKMRKGFSKKEARTGAYEWLSKEMGIPIEQTHIGMFDIEQCKKVIAICKPYNDKLSRKDEKTADTR